MDNSQSLSQLYKRVNTATVQFDETISSFDTIVIGIGSMGSAACYYLAKAGQKVLGIEQFSISHENGSHGGQSRLIRQAYFEHPNYVPLLQRAYENWKALELEAETKLFYPTGILYSGISDDFLIQGSKQSALEHHLPLEELSHQQQHHRYPQFKIPEKYSILFEHNAGFVTPERAILTFADRAIQNGASIHSNEKVTSWRSKGDALEVLTNKGKYQCKKLIFTAGAWSGELSPFLKSNLKVTRQLVAWVKTKDDSRYQLNKMPCWGINSEGFPGLFYGFPVLDINSFGGFSGMKLGYHLPGEEIETDSPNPKKVPKKETEILTEFLNQFMPGCFKDINEISYCKYTYSPDEHFIIDHHPGNDKVIMAGGFSGHGFKFAPVVGEILADFAIKNGTDQPVDFLSGNRFNN